MKYVALAAATLLIVGCGTAGTASAASRYHVSPPAPVHTALATTCETLNVEVRVKNGMPGEYILHLCGPGVPAYSVGCTQPAGVYGLPNENATLSCGATPS